MIAVVAARLGLAIVLAAASPATASPGTSTPSPAPVASASPATEATASPAPTPATSPSPTPATSPSPTPAASPSTAPLLVNGQIVDYERGYVVFASGDAFKVAPDVTIVDDATDAAPTYAVVPGVYALAALDQTSALVTSIRTSLRPLPGGVPAAKVPPQFVSVASPRLPNPDLAPPPVQYRSKLSPDVLVTITVEVPPDTPNVDDVYITTDSSGWNAQAIKMQRIDGRHFRILVHLKGGAAFHYLFTRGSWQSVERDRSGLQRSARYLEVPGGDSMNVSLTVFRWADLQ